MSQPDRTWNGVDERLKMLSDEVQGYFPHALLEGKRTPERQKELFDNKKSKTLQSKHINGDAIDIAPLPLDWQDVKRFYYFGGFVKAIAAAMGISIRWGGDWDNDYEVKDNSFNDLVHFELRD